MYKQIKLSFVNTSTSPGNKEEATIFCNRENNGNGGDDPEKLSLKKNVKFHLFTTEIPCEC